MRPKDKIQKRNISCKSHVAQKLDILSSRLKDVEGSSIASLRIGGSAARGSSDRFSDVDIFLVSEEPGLAGNLVETVANSLGGFLVRDVVRSDGTWGHWTTGYFRDFGYVDICCFDCDHPGVTHMTDNSSVVLFDRVGDLETLIAELPSQQDMKEEFASGCAAQAWLMSYKAAKEVSRGGFLQFEKYLLNSVEGTVGIFRSAEGIAPLGNNWDQTLRNLEQDLPDIAIQVSELITPAKILNGQVFEACRDRLSSSIELLKQALELAIRNDLPMSDHINDIDCGFLESATSKMLKG